MKVTMKLFEQKAIEYASRFKSWELSCVAKDAYLTAYKEAVVDVKTLVDDRYYDYDWSPTSQDFNDVGQEEVSVDLPNGSHQLIDDIKPESSHQALADDFLKEV